MKPPGEPGGEIAGRSFRIAPFSFVLDPGRVPIWSLGAFQTLPAEPAIHQWFSGRGHCWLRTHGKGTDMLRVLTMAVTAAGLSASALAQDIEVKREGPVTLPTFGLVSARSARMRAENSGS